MRGLVVGLGLVLATSSFAATKAQPLGNGNFRRAEVVKAAGATARYTNVVGMATSRRDMNAPKDPKAARIMFVAHTSGDVTLIKAPLDKSQPVSRLSQAQANRLGVVTQAQARKAAEKNAGEVGSKGKVVLKNAGMSARKGSYSFVQKAPLNFTVKSNGTGERAKATYISRTVSITGKAESATPALTTIATK